MDGYSNWQLLLGAGIATSTYIFVIVQLLNNLIPRWKEYVGLEERRDQMVPLLVGMTGLTALLFLRRAWKRDPYNKKRQ